MDHPETDPHAKLRALDVSLDNLKETLPKPVIPRDREEGQAVRMVSDFAAAFVVGSGIGYGLDQWLGTSPWLLIAGLLLGTAAGTKLLLEMEKRISGNTENAPPKAGAFDDENDDE